MDKLVYENKQGFAILADDLQWVLAMKKDVQKDGRVIWRDRTFYPNLFNLMDALAEKQFRKMAVKVSELKDLEKTVLKVYELIGEVSGVINENQSLPEAV